MDICIIQNLKVGFQYQKLIKSKIDKVYALGHQTSILSGMASELNLFPSNKDNTK